jgi:hypothetical protein
MEATSEGRKARHDARPDSAFVAEVNEPSGAPAASGPPSSFFGPTISSSLGGYLDPNAWFARAQRMVGSWWPMDCMTQGLIRIGCQYVRAAAVTDKGCDRTPGRRHAEQTPRVIIPWVGTRRSG